MLAQRVMRDGLVIIFTGLALLGGVLTGFAQEQIHTGYMGDDVDDDYYPIYLQAGQTISVSAEATSGDLDTYIMLLDTGQNTIIENDDRDSTTYDSYFTYTAAISGQYYVVMSNYPDSSGNYRLTITITTGGAAVPDRPAPSASPVANAQTFTGFMGDNVDDAMHEIRLEAGEALIATADATSGDLDTYLLLLDANGQEVAYNDDANDSLNSELIFVAEQAGIYTLVLTNWGGTSGNYRLSFGTLPGDQVTPQGRVAMSGPVLTIDTPNFRVHYTLQGSDATTEVFARQVAEALEEVWEIQINQMGWPAPPVDGVRGGDARYDVYILELLSELEGGDLGYTMPELRPYGVEMTGVPSYIVIDRAYNDPELLDGRTPVSLMRATVAHEYNHAVQFGFAEDEPHGWYYEATASWMETSTFPREQDAVGYVNLVFEYPEICLGAEGDADPSGGTMMYGEWLFIQTLVDEHGMDIPIRLWENIASYDGWDALEATLSPLGDTIQAAAVRYHIQNLLRSYKLASQFDDKTVWLEMVIDRVGEWQGNPGVQELGANFMELALNPGIYGIQVVNATLDLWAIGIRGETADVFSLASAGTVNTAGYDYFYVMIFHPQPARDVESCVFRTYTLNVQPGTGTPAQPVRQMSARQFVPLQ